MKSSFSVFVFLFAFVAGFVSFPSGSVQASDDCPTSVSTPTETKIAIGFGYAVYSDLVHGSVMDSTTVCLDESGNLIEPEVPMICSFSDSDGSSLSYESDSDSQTQSGSPPLETEYDRRMRIGGYNDNVVPVPKPAPQRAPRPTPQRAPRPSRGYTNESLELQELRNEIKALRHERQLDREMRQFQDLLDQQQRHTDKQFDMYDRNRQRREDNVRRQLGDIQRRTQQQIDALPDMPRTYTIEPNFIPIPGSPPINPTYRLTPSPFGGLGL